MNLDSWLAEDVAEGLRSEGFAEHASAFLENAVCGQIISDIDDADLINIGVARLGDRKRLLRAISQLGQQAKFSDIRSKTSQILAAIRASRATIIVAPTGFGKSVHIPQMLLDERGGEGRRILCTQPRRVAASSLARRVADVRGVELGKEVGLQIRGLSEVSRAGTSRLVYATTAIAVLQLAQDGFAFSHLVSDEVHIRDVWIDLLLTLVAKRFLTNVKVVMLSAALDHNALETYFRDLEPKYLNFETCRPYPLTERYREDFEYFRFQRVVPDWTQEEIANDIGGFIIHLHESEPRRPSSPGSSDVGFGSFLVFLPGRRELELVADRLDEDERLDMVVRAVHGGQTIETQEHLLRVESPEAVRTVFLATDVIESSVTIPDVDVVVDTCEHKRFIWNPIRKQSMLTLMRISVDEAKQRAGRAGRCRPGKVIRLLSRTDFAKLEQHVSPATLTSRLDTVVLTVCALTNVIRDPRSFLLSMPEPPKPESVDAAITRLYELNALRDRPSTTHDRGMPSILNRCPTIFGSFLMKMPLDPEAGCLVWNGVRHGLARECAILAAVHERGDPFLSSSDWGPQQIRALFAARQACSHAALPSDLVLGMRAYQAWKEANKGRITPRSLGDQEAWCTNHYLSFSRLHEIDVEVIEILTVLEHCALYPGVPQDEKNQLRLRQQMIASAGSRQSRVHWCGPTGRDDAGAELGKLLRAVRNEDEDLLLCWCIAASFIHGIAEITCASSSECVLFKPRRGRHDKFERELQILGLNVAAVNQVSRDGICTRFAGCADARRALQTAALARNRTLPWREARQWRSVPEQPPVVRKCYRGGRWQIVSTSVSLPLPCDDGTVIAADVAPLFSQTRGTTTYIGSKCSVAPRGIFPFVWFVAPAHREVEMGEHEWTFTGSFHGVGEECIYNAPSPEVQALLKDLRANWDSQFDLEAAATDAAHRIVQGRRRAVLSLMHMLMSVGDPPMIRLGSSTESS